MLPLVFIYLLAPAVRSQDLLQFDAGAGETLPVQCEDFNLTWAGGTPPFRLDITTFQSRTWTETHERIRDRFYLWQVDFGEGSLLLIILTDGEGQDTISRSLPEVQPSEDDSCVFHPPGAPSPSTSTASPSTSTATSSTRRTTSTTSSSTKTASPTSSVTASTTSQSTVTTESPSLSTSPSPSPVSSRSSTLSSPSTSRTSSSVSLFPSSSAGANTGASLHGGAIAGIAVGAALVLAIAALLCYWARRRRRQGSRSQSLEDDSPEMVTDVPKLSPFTKGAPMMSHASVLDISSGGDGSYSDSSAVEEDPSELLPTVEDGTLTVSLHVQPPSSEIEQSAGADAVPLQGSNSRPPVKSETSSAQPLARPRDPLIQPVTASSTRQGVRTPRRGSRSSNVAARLQRSHRTEVDGGVRLAGGPADELYEDGPDEDARTLPPPYQRF